MKFILSEKLVCKYDKEYVNLNLSVNRIQYINYKYNIPLLDKNI